MDQPNRYALVTRLMQQVRLFEGFSRFDVETFLQYARKREADYGERVIQQGDKGRSMFVLLSGSVQILAYTEEGSEEHVLAQLEAGDTFGELSLLDQWPRSASVVALTPLLMLEFDRRYLPQMPEVLPKLFRNVAFLIGSRLRHANSMISLTLDSNSEASAKVSAALPRAGREVRSVRR